MLIHAGDCIGWMEAMADASVDHCIADPPYSEHVHAKSMRSGDKKARQTKGHGKYVKGTAPTKRDLGFVSLTPELQRSFVIEVARITRRWCLVFCDPESIGTWRFDLRGAGLDVVRVGVWIKPNSAPQFTGDRPGTGYEAIVIAHRPGRKKWNGGGRNAVFTHPIATGHYGRERVHMTEKPLPLMQELVSLFTDPGELVIDPFAGGGTTGAACIRLGRLFAGAELDPAMAAIAEERLAAEREDSSLRERSAGQLTIRAALDSAVPS